MPTAAYNARSIPCPQHPMPAVPTDRFAPCAPQVCWGMLDQALALQALGVMKALFLAPSDHKRILFVGPGGSGAGFHDHSNAFNLLIYGSKRWLLLPPSGTYMSEATKGVTSPAEWLRRHEKAPEGLPIQPLTCVQPAGTALFVPSGWKHAVLNAVASVAVAVEVGDADVMRRAAAAAAGVSVDKVG